MAYRCPIDQKLFDEFEKETIAIKESLEILLPTFETSSDWAGIEKRLKRIKKLLEVKKSPFIAQKSMLFRRLAQSLNPALDIGVHLTVLEIYDLYLENLKRSPENIINELHHVTLGLFSYAIVCPNDSRKEIMKILENHFLPLGTKLGPLLPALFGALLPSLIDNYEIMKNRLFVFFDKLRDIFSMHIISIAIWQNIKRSQSCRYGGLMYLTHCISKKDNIEDMSSSFVSDDENNIQIEDNKTQFLTNYENADFKKKDSNQKIEENEENAFGDYVNKFQNEDNLFAYEDNLEEVDELEKDDQKNEDDNIQQTPNQDQYEKNLKQNQQNNDNENQKYEEKHQQHENNHNQQHENNHNQQHENTDNDHHENNYNDHQENNNNDHQENNYNDHQENNYNDHQENNNNNHHENNYIEQHENNLNDNQKNNFNEQYDKNYNENYDFEHDEHHDDENNHHEVKYNDRNDLENYEHHEVKYDDRNDLENYEHHEVIYDDRHDEDNEHHEVEYNDHQDEKNEHDDDQKEKKNLEKNPIEGNLNKSNNNEKNDELAYPEVKNKKNNLNSENENQSENNSAENTQKENFLNQQNEDSEKGSFEIVDNKEDYFESEQTPIKPIKNEETINILEDKNVILSDVQKMDLTDNSQDMKRSSVVKPKTEAELTAEKQAIAEKSSFNKFVEFSKMKFAEKMQQLEKYDEFFGKKDLVLEALIECLQDPDPFIKKKGLDFIINFMSVENNKRNLSENEIIVLTRNCLLMLSDSDLSVRRRVFRYILGPELEEEEDEESEEDKQEHIPENLLNIFFIALKYILTDFEKNNLFKIFKVLQTIMMEKENIIDSLISRLNLELMDALVFLSEEQEEINDPSLGTEKIKSIKSSTRRFFESIISHFESFLNIYILNDKKRLTNQAITLLYDFTITHNEDKELYFIRLNFILEGYLKVAIKVLEEDKLKKECFDCLENLSNLISKTDEKCFCETSEELKELMIVYLQAFQNLISNFEIMDQQKTSKLENNHRLKIFEKGLLLSTWILLKLENKQLIENWVKDIEIFLNKVVSNPDFILATIKGIYKFFTTDTKTFQIVKDTLQSILNLAIKKAWELFDNIEYHSQAIKLILQLNEQNSETMINLLNNNLNKENINIRINFVRRLVIFWNLTENLELSKKDRVLENYCIFRLLDFLENDHPVLRQISKSWLIDSSEKYFRIVDPMIIKLLKNSFFFKTLDDQLVHYKKYDVGLVFKIYKRIKNLLTNDSGTFSDFFNKTQISDNLLIEMYNHLTQKELKKNQQYYQLLMNIIMKFMRAYTLCFLGNNFEDENLLIKTASCENLEIIINCLYEKNPKIVDQKMIDKIQQTYYINVKSGCSMMQIHLLNLLKVVIFKKISENKNEKKDAFQIKKVFQENNLIDIVLESIQYAQNNYTLLKIIDFLNTIIQLYCREFKEENIKEMVEKIFNYYYNYLLELKNNKSLNTHSKMIIVQSGLKMVSKFCNLDNFVIPKNREEDNYSFMGMLTFGAFGRKKYIPAPVNFKTIENYFLDNLEKVIQIIIFGWKLLHFEYDFLESFNIGFNGFKDTDQEDKYNKYLVSYVHLKNEEICSFTEKVYYKYQIQFFENLLNNWYKIYLIDNDRTNFRKLKKKKHSEKIIDMLIYLNLDFFEFDQKIKDSLFFKNLVKERKAKSFTIKYDLAQKEASLLCLYYAYLKFVSYKFIEDKKERKDFLRKFWLTLVKTLMNFTKTDHVFVMMWIINIYYICSRKYPLQEIISEYSVKRYLHDHENLIFDKIIEMTCDKNGSKMESYSKEENKFTFLYPVPSKLVEIFLDKWNLYESKIFLDFRDEVYLKYFTKIMSLVFLQKVTIKLLTSTYESDKSHHIAKRLYILISKLFNELINNTEENEMTKKIHEEIIEYIFVFLDTSRNFLLKNIKNLLQNYFDSDRFFHTSHKSLNFLSSIIKWHVMANEDVLRHYLEK